MKPQRCKTGKLYRLPQLHNVLLFPRHFFLEHFEAFTRRLFGDSQTLTYCNCTWGCIGWLYLWWNEMKWRDPASECLARSKITYSISAVKVTKLFMESASCEKSLTCFLMVDFEVWCWSKLSWPTAPVTKV